MGAAVAAIVAALLGAYAFFGDRAEANREEILKEKEAELLQEAQLRIAFVDFPAELSRSNPIHTVVVQVLNEGPATASELKVRLLYTYPNEDGPSYTEDDDGHSSAILAAGESMEFEWFFGFESRADVLAAKEFSVRAEAAIENGQTEHSKVRWVTIVP